LIQGVFQPSSPEKSFLSPVKQCAHCFYDVGDAKKINTQSTLRLTDRYQIPLPPEACFYRTLTMEGAVINSHTEPNHYSPSLSAPIYFSATRPLHDIEKEG
jgi:hypothetical protein